MSADVSHGRETLLLFFTIFFACVVKYFIWPLKILTFALVTFIWVHNFRKKLMILNFKRQNVFCKIRIGLYAGSVWQIRTAGARVIDQSNSRI